MQLNKAIQQRETIKILANQPWPTDNTISKAKLYEIIELGNYAPFHYASHKSHQQQGSSLNSIVPWRFYTLTAKNCRKLATHIKENNIDGGKITKMLHCAEALIICTWLPDPPKQALPANMQFEPTIRNIEHIAAVGAAVQNILLAATSMHLGNYWSSGGVLTSAALKNHLQIPLNQLLLAAVFLFKDTQISEQPVTIKKGKLRHLKGEVHQWHRFIEVK